MAASLVAAITTEQKHDELCKVPEEAGQANDEPRRGVCGRENCCRDEENAGQPPKAHIKRGVQKVLLQNRALRVVPGRVCHAMLLNGK